MVYLFKLSQRLANLKITISLKKSFLGLKISTAFLCNVLNKFMKKKSLDSYLI